MPGTYAAPDELLAIGDVLGRHGRGVFEAAARLGEGDDDSLTNTKAEIRWMGELSRRTGRPVTFGLAQSDRRPDLYARVIQLTEEGNLIGGRVRPQTTARGIGILFGLANRTPYRPMRLRGARSATCRSLIASRRCAIPFGARR